MENEKILATVGGVHITEAEVDTFIESLPKEQQVYKTIPQFRQQCVEQLVSLQLYALMAEEEKLDETEEFQTMIAGARKEILANLAMKKSFANITVTEEECLEFYKSNPQHFVQGESVSAKHILVKEEEKALELLSDITAGKMSFEDAAKECSTCPSGQQGGDLGAFTRGQMVPEFDAAAFEAEIDHIVGPVKTQFGYHLIKVYAKTEAAVTPFEQAVDAIRTNLTVQKQNESYMTTVAMLKAKYMA